MSELFKTEKAIYAHGLVDAFETAAASVQQLIDDRGDIPMMASDVVNNMLQMKGVGEQLLQGHSEEEIEQINKVLEVIKS